MRIFRCAVAISALLVLSACADIRASRPYRMVEGIPAYMERNIGNFPTGYTGQNAYGKAVLKPPGLEPAIVEHTVVTEYRGPADVVAVPVAPPVLAPVVPPPQGAVIEYSDAVTVFPIDDADVVPPRYADTGYMTAPSDGPVYTAPVAGPQGDPDLEIFFGHGSSRIGTGDKQRIVSLAKTAKKSELAVTVVGHASKRVNTTDDPGRKKEINFEMAQKRANAVTHTLTSAGIDPAWVMAISKGDEEPNLRLGAKTQEEADRRAEIFMGGK